MTLRARAVVAVHLTVPPAERSRRMYRVPHGQKRPYMRGTCVAGGMAEGVRSFAIVSAVTNQPRKKSIPSSQSAHATQGLTRDPHVVREQRPGVQRSADRASR